MPITKKSTLLTGFAYILYTAKTSVLPIVMPRTNARYVSSFPRCILLLSLILIPRTVSGQASATDVVGTTVTVQRIPQRIISLIPSNTELLFAIGAGNSVVGVTNYCDYPPEAGGIDKIGDVTSMSLEKIVALDPDLVLASRGNNKELVYSLKALDVPVFVLDPQSIEEVLEAIGTVGKLAGREEAARELLDGYRQRLTAVADRIGDLSESERPSVFVGSPFRDENWTPGPGTYTSAVIRRAGGRNVADDLPPRTWSVYSLENIISKNPQVLLSTLREGEDPVETTKKYLERAKSLDGWRDLDAVRNERVVLIPENWLIRPAPRLLDAIETLAGALHPNLF